MKKVLCVVLLVMSVESYAQDALSLYNLGNVSQVYQFNPADYDEYPSSLTLPLGGYFNYHNDLSFNDIFTETKNAYSIDEDTILNKLYSDDISERFLLELKLDLLYYSFKLPHNTTVRIFANLKAFSNFYYPPELLEAYLKGWGGDNIGRTLSGNINFEGMAFAEVGVGITRGFGRSLQLGANLKYYQGLFHINTNNTFVSIKSDSNTFGLEISSKDFEISSKDDLPNSGWGAGVDLGATYDLGLTSNVPLRFGVSVLDLGFIEWEDIKTATADYGAQVIDKLSDLNSSKTSIYFSNYKTETSSKRTVLPYKIFGSVSYYPTEKDLVTLSNFNTFYNRETVSNISLGYTRKIWRNKVGLNVSGVKLAERPVSLGLGFSMRFGVLQFYAASDDAINLVKGFADVSNDLKYMNLRVGFNFIFGMPKVTGKSGRNRSSNRSGGGGILGKYQSRGSNKSSSSGGSSTKRSNTGNVVGRGGGVRYGSKGGFINTHEYICTFCRPPRRQ